MTNWGADRGCAPRPTQEVVSAGGEDELTLSSGEPGALRAVAGPCGATAAISSSDDCHGVREIVSELSNRHKV